MVVHEDRITALIPQEQGLLIPFEFHHEPGESDALKWDLSYLYAELWSMRGQGPRLITCALPEFTTDASRPTAIRVPLSSQAMAMLDGLRRGGDLTFILHIQATLVGTIARDRIPDDGRRQTLEALGLEYDVFGPIRRSDDVTIHISRVDWEEEILPQWSTVGLESSEPSMPLLREPTVNGHKLDVYALARSLQGATGGGDLEDILRQCRDPMVGL